MNEAERRAFRAEEHKRVKALPQAMNNWEAVSAAMADIRAGTFRTMPDRELAEKDQRIAELEQRVVCLEAMTSAAINSAADDLISLMAQKLNYAEHDRDEAQRRRDVLLDRIRVLEMADKNQPTAPQPDLAGVDAVTHQCVLDGLVAEDQLRAHGFTRSANGNWTKAAPVDPNSPLHRAMSRGRQ